MSQSRLASATEAATNIAIGYTVAVAAQVVIFPIAQQRIDNAKQSG